MDAPSARVTPPPQSGNEMELVSSNENEDYSHHSASISVVDPGDLIDGTASMPSLARRENGAAASLRRSASHRDLGAMCLRISPALWRSVLFEFLTVKEAIRFSRTCKHFAAALNLDKRLLKYIARFNVSSDAEMRYLVLKKEDPEGDYDHPESYQPLILNLYGAKGLTDESFFLSTATNSNLHILCTRLARLELTGCDGVTDKSLRFIAQHCKRLSSLIIDRRTVVNIERNGYNGKRVSCITDQGMAALADAQPPLKELVLIWTRDITDAGTTAMFSKCTTLQRVSLHWSKVTNLTCSSLGSLMHLTCLEIRACQEVNDVGLASIAAGCPALKELALIGLVVTDVGLMNIAKAHGANLVSLHLSDLDKMTSNALSGNGGFASYCRGKLTNLRISHMGADVSEASICELIDATDLKRCHLSWMACVGDETVRALTRSAPRLISLILDQTGPISSRMLLEELMNACWHLVRMECMGAGEEPLHFTHERIANKTSMQRVFYRNKAW